MRSAVQGTIVGTEASGNERDLVERNRPTLARVTVTTAIDDALDSWRELADCAPISAYQTADFLGSWLATEGAAEATSAFIVTAFDSAGRPIALLPLGLRRRGSLRIASYLGGKHSNYNLGLFRPGYSWGCSEIEALLRQAARAAEGGIDLFVLANQPFRWNGVANPMAALPHQPSPSSSHRTLLSSDPEDYFHRHHSAHARRVLRSKQKKLAALGPVRSFVARSAAEREAVLAAYLAQKSEKNLALGIAHALDQPAQQDFLRRLAGQHTPDREPILELHALESGGRIVATFGGLQRDHRFSGLLISHDGTPLMARTSPGEQLLVEVIRRKCEEGSTQFDLGVGEARYKQTYCRIEDPLFDTLLPVSVLGRLCTGALGVKLMLKRKIKRSPRLWAASRMVLRMRGRLRESRLKR